MVTGFSVHDDAEEAKRRGGDGFRYFGYSLGHYYVFGDYQPAQTQIWSRFEQARDKLAEVGKGSGIGTPTQVAEHLIQQGGKNKHEHICDAMRLFADTVMPQFKANEAEREAKKAAELAPYIEAAMARKQCIHPGDFALWPQRHPRRSGYDGKRYPPRRGRYYGAAARSIGGNAPRTGGWRLSDTH